MSSPSFADRIRQQVEAAQQSSAGPNPFRTVLDELAAGLTSADVTAQIVEGRDPRRVSLVLFPAHQPARRHTMLTFWVADNAIAVLSDPQRRPMTDPAELEAWLLEFAKQPAFVDSLAELGDLARGPVEGFLRGIGVGQLSRDDVLVEVSAADQARLDDAPTGTDLEIDVAFSTLPGAGRYSSAKPPVAFESNGLALTALQVVSADANGLRICGKKVAR